MCGDFACIRLMALHADIKRPQDIAFESRHILFVTPCDNAPCRAAWLNWNMKKRWVRALLLLAACLQGQFALAQTCAAPGKDAPGTISGIVNRYYQGTGSPASGATTLTLGAASGAAGTVTVGDLLLVIQMQGASIDVNNDERYGDGSGTAANTPITTASQANGYTALNQAGLYEFVRVTQVAGLVVTFTPALTNAYVQNTAAPRRTYQVIRVPQYPSATINSASPVLPLGWTGLVGGVAAFDVTGAITTVGSGPHVDASNRGFRGGVHQAAPNSSLPGTFNYRSANYNDGGSKGEGIAGTQRYVQTSLAGSYNAGTTFNDANATFTDNGATGYTNGDTMRGAPANAGGGGKQPQRRRRWRRQWRRRRQRWPDLQRRHTKPGRPGRLWRLARAARRGFAGDAYFHGRRRRLWQHEQLHPATFFGRQRWRHHHGARRQHQRGYGPAGRRAAGLG
jgi:hypothetical protein